MTQEPAIQSPFPRIAAIGLGLIGGSFAKRIHKQFPKTVILGFDNPKTLEQAKTAGVITETLSDLNDPKLLKVDLVILGTHVSKSYEILADLAKLNAPTPLKIMDLGSTKSKICEIADSLPGSFSFIGGHPLAGREVSGFEHSQPDLFRGKRFLLTPCQKTDPTFQAQLVTWLEALEVMPCLIEPEDHDAKMALVSHFPQFYAVALANLLHQNNPAEALNFLGGGIDDQMRLMRSSDEMWCDVFEDNRDKVLPIIEQFVGILNGMKADLESDKPATLKPWFDTSHQIYEQYRSSRS